MSGVYEFPKLRWPIDVRIEKIDSDEILLLMCPLGVSSSPLALVPAVAPVISCFEGNLSVKQILERFTSAGLTEQLLRELIEVLDQHLFLASPKFFAAQQSMLEAFTLSDTRPAALAGLSYSNTKAELEKEIDSYLKDGQTLLKIRNETMWGLVTPHIDYRRGALCYGTTYNHLKQEDHNLYIVIGTSHQYSRHLFHLTTKDFESPLGKLHCDKQFVKKLANQYGEIRSFADEILHKKEHSLELQLPFIKRLKNNPTIVPILVGSFHHMLKSGKWPENFEEYDKFVSCFCDCLKDYISGGKKICIIAGVDMAHVGKHFGDSDSLSPAFMDKIAERDKEYLNTIVKQDKHAMFSHIAEDQDARRICGFPTMYTVIDCLERIGVKYRSEVIDYRQAVNYKTDCAVTFAGVGLYANRPHGI